MFQSHLSLGQCPVESTLPQAHHRITITSTSTLRQAHALMKHIVNCTSTSTTLLPQGCALMKVHYKHKHIINCTSTSTSTLLQARALMKALPQAAPDHFLSCLFKPLIHKQEHCLHPTKQEKITAVPITEFPTTHFHKTQYWFFLQKSILSIFATFFWLYVQN